MNKYSLNVFAALVVIGYLAVVSIAEEKFGYILIIATLSILGLYFGYKAISQIVKISKSKGHSKVSALKFIATLMVFFLITGTLIYLKAFNTAVIVSGVTSPECPHSKFEFSNIELLFRSLIASLDLFMLDIDNNLLEAIKAEKHIKAAISVQAVISFSCTVAMLVAFVYSRLDAYYNLHYRTKINKEKNHLYLFWGNNRATELLIKDISKNDPRAVIIIIDRANVDDDEMDEWQSIVRMLTHRQNVLQLVNTTKIRIAIANQQLMEIDKDIVNMDKFDAFEALGIQRIKRFITKLVDIKQSQLHIFFIGEDEDSNIQNILTLSKDSTISELSGHQNIEHCIYCHARYNGPNRVVKDVAVKNKLNIKIIDSSHFAIELLKLNPDEHPINVMSLNEKNLGAVDSKLTALIIGFGEVGRDAFRFLYEFGAFVDCSQEENRSPFECVIVDKNMNNIEGIFKSSMPGIFSAGTHKNTNVDIQFVKADFNDSCFNHNVLHQSFLERVNYIVIAIDNSDEASFLATRIFSQIRQLRKDLRNVRILVRCKDEAKLELMEKTFLHYNQGYGDGEENTPVIRIFGHPGNIYTYDLIVSNRMETEGKVYHEKYRLVTKERETWEERRRKLTSDAIPNIDNLRKLRRQESQTIANALHSGTKIYLIKKAMESLYFERVDGPDWDSFLSRYFKDGDNVNAEGKMDHITYPELTEKENQIIRNLAILEHLRWNAAHELMGYVFNKKDNKCDERTMQHNCLCPWAMLDNQSKKTQDSDWPCDYKKYDFSVIDATLALHKQKLYSDNFSIL